MERIFVSQIIHAPADAVWALVRDFNGMPGWHPAIADSAIEQDRPADAVGCVRNFHLADGGHLREQLVELSDSRRVQRYIILESPMPVTGYDATISVVPITETDEALVTWQAEFEVADADAVATVDNVKNNVFRAGMAAIEEQLGNSSRADR